jgi:plastocyanin
VPDVGRRDFLAAGGVTLLCSLGGVKKFHSDDAASDFSFARTLKKPGKYVVICTLHADVMRMTIRVKR